MNANTNFTSEWIGIRNIEEFTIQAYWSGLDAVDGVLTVEVTIDKSIENLVSVIETKTLDSATGNHLFVATKAKYGYYRYKYTKNSNTAGTITVATI